MVTSNRTVTAVGLVAATVLSFGTFAAAATPASAKSTCAGGGAGVEFSEAHPERAKTFGKDRNATKFTEWPGVSGACSPNGTPEKQQGTTP